MSTRDRCQWIFHLHSVWSLIIFLWITSPLLVLSPIQLNTDTCTASFAESPTKPNRKHARNNEWCLAYDIHKSSKFPLGISRGSVHLATIFKPLPPRAINYHHHCINHHHVTSHVCKLRFFMQCDNRCSELIRRQTGRWLWYWRSREECIDYSCC